MAVFVILFSLLAFRQLNQGQRAEGKAQLERSLRRAAVACYTAEGVYPPSLDYLQTHYGVQVDSQKFTVSYTVFADNLMPDILVLEHDYG